MRLQKGKEMMGITGRESFVSPCHMQSLDGLSLSYISYSVVWCFIHVYKRKGDPGRWLWTIEREERRYLVTSKKTEFVYLKLQYLP